METPGGSHEAAAGSAQQQQAQPPPAPEVIEILSDDDDDDEQDDEQQPLPWPEAIERLLEIARDHKQRHDLLVLPALMRDLRVGDSINVRCALRAACEALGRLLGVARGNTRQLRVNTLQPMVLCEILSLAQIASPRRPAKDVRIKLESAERATASGLQDLMQQWRQAFHKAVDTPTGLQSAFSKTLARLEEQREQCTRELEPLRIDKAMHLERKEAAAQSYTEVLTQRRQEQERERPEKIGDAVGPDDRVVDMLYRTVVEQKDLVAEFEMHQGAYRALARQEKLLQTRGEFYESALALLRAVAEQRIQQLSESQENDNDQCALKTQLNQLSAGLLTSIEDFCAALQSVMSEERPTGGGESAWRATHVSLARELELFWLLHRNRLPSAVVEVVVTQFEALHQSSAARRTGCPISGALSRICAELGPVLAASAPASAE